MRAILLASLVAIAFATGVTAQAANDGTTTGGTGTTGDAGTTNTGTGATNATWCPPDNSTATGNATGTTGGAGTDSGTMGDAGTTGDAWTTGTTGNTTDTNMTAECPPPSDTTGGTGQADGTVTNGTIGDDGPEEAVGGENDTPGVGLLLGAAAVGAAAFVLGRRR